MKWGLFSSLHLGYLVSSVKIDLLQYNLSKQAWVKTRVGGGGDVGWGGRSMNGEEKARQGYMGILTTKRPFLQSFGKEGLFILSPT